MSAMTDRSTAMSNPVEMTLLRRIRKVSRSLCTQSVRLIGAINKLFHSEAFCSIRSRNKIICHLKSSSKILFRNVNLNLFPLWKDRNYEMYKKF